MPELIHKVLALLSPRERRQAYLLLGMILVMAFLDMVGVASIMPFMAVLANPQVIESNTYLNAVYTHLNFTDPQAFLFFLGVAVFAALLLSITFKALTTYASTRFTTMREYSIGRRLVSGYLHQPYAWFLDRHSADLGKTILSEVQQVIVGAIKPLMDLIAQGTVLIAMLILLLLVDPLLALMVGGVLGLAYGLIYRLARGYLGRIGAERLQANKERFETVTEAFGGIKDVKVGGLEQAYTRRFEKPAQRYANHQATATIIGAMPRYALEAIAFGGMLMVVLYLLDSDGGLENALPIIALYALAGYRMMPAIQLLYMAITKLRFASAALDNLHSDIMVLAPPVPRGKAQAGNAIAPLPFTREIRLNNIQYRYPKAAQPTLRNLSLAIPVRSTVGLVGSTGSGKTTTVDLILGLLESEQGTLEVDGTPIGPHNRRAWQKNIGYVPQHIYLADDTVAANIAFGLTPEQIDQAAVERAARIANLHRFVTDELPQGYATTVGERGVRLSGGQRQRIGIARALYHQPKVLILDEATSALDNLTEQAVMEAVHNLGGEITIVMIAHRLSTVRECNRIYLLEHGKLAGQGSYSELTATNARFRAMAGD